MKDLVFTKDKFKYELTKAKAFRNYLMIEPGEIVNMPDLGVSVEVWSELANEGRLPKGDKGGRQPTPSEIKARFEFIRNSIIDGAKEYDILVKSYETTYSDDGILQIFNVIFG